MYPSLKHRIAVARHALEEAALSPDCPPSELLERSWALDRLIVFAMRIKTRPIRRLPAVGIRRVRPCGSP